jgi:hypothetical protein
MRNETPSIRPLAPGGIMENCEASKTICMRKEEFVNGSLVLVLPSTVAFAFGTTATAPIAALAQSKDRTASQHNVL